MNHLLHWKGQSSKLVDFDRTVTEQAMLANYRDCVYVSDMSDK
jgi:hypothetical protein